MAETPPGHRARTRCRPGAGPHGGTAGGRPRLAGRTGVQPGVLGRRRGPPSAREGGRPLLGRERPQYGCLPQPRADAAGHRGDHRGTPRSGPPARRPGPGGPRLPDLRRHRVAAAGDQDGAGLGSCRTGHRAPQPGAGHQRPRSLREGGPLPRRRVPPDTGAGRLHRRRGRHGRRRRRPHGDGGGIGAELPPGGHRPDPGPGRPGRGARGPLPRGRLPRRLPPPLPRPAPPSPGSPPSPPISTSTDTPRRGCR